MSDGLTSLTIELQDDALQRTLQSAIAGLEHPQRLMQAIGALMERNVQFRFDTKTAPDGTPWAPITPATKAIYESDWFIERNPAFKGGIPGSLLERTRQMRDSLAVNAGDDYVEIGMTRLSNGGKWQIPALHELGTEKMVPRRLLTADPETGTLGASDRADILAEVESYLQDLL